MNKIKIIDWLSNKDSWSYYKLYNQTQWYSRDEMNLLQVEKLKKLLNHCYINVPYYRSIIDKEKIDITNFSSVDVLNEFPLLTKEIIQENYKDFTPLNISKIKGVKASQTGGTTGNILLKRNDAASRSSVWGSYKRYEDWMGIADGDKRLTLMGGHVKKSGYKQRLKSKVARYLKNSVEINIYDTSDETVEHVINLLTKNNFQQIRAYPQFLFSVAKILEQRGLEINIKAISTTAEPTMSEQRNVFRKVFNAEVFDQYGCGEIGGIAYECDQHKGLHITEEHVIVETNEKNELIITDLDNFSMPFIRYWNADQAIISDEKCTCERNSKLITQVMGRTCDYVTGLNGQFLHWAYFWHLVFDSNIAIRRNLRKFQIVQQSLNSLLIRLVSDELSAEEEEFFVQDIKRRIGDVKVEFSYEADIENSKTGKYRPVISLLQN